MDYGGLGLSGFGDRQKVHIDIISCTGQLISSIKLWLQILKYLYWYWQSEGWIWLNMCHITWVIPGIFISNLTAYFNNVDRKPKPHDHRQIQLDLSDLAQIETQLNNSFWKIKRKIETMNQMVSLLLVEAWLIPVQIGRSPDCPSYISSKSWLIAKYKKSMRWLIVDKYWY